MPFKCNERGEEQMMHLIYAMFNRQIDKKTAGTIELEQLFVERARRGSHFANDYAFKDVVETGTLAFLRAWKIVRHSLDTRSSAKLNRDNELLQALIKQASGHILTFLATTRMSL